MLTEATIAATAVAVGTAATAAAVVIAAATVAAQIARVVVVSPIAVWGVMQFEAAEDAISLNFAVTARVRSATGVLAVLLAVGWKGAAQAGGDLAVVVEALPATAGIYQSLINGAETQALLAALGALWH